MKHTAAAVWLLALSIGTLRAEAKPVTADLAIGETHVHVTAAGERIPVTLLGVREETDPFRGAVRRAMARVSVNGAEATLESAQYNIPRVINGVKIDAPVTRGLTANSGSPAVWDLDPDADARLRFWDPDQPLLEPGTFAYPAEQRWFASDTQMANEPTFVDGGENPDNKRIYYHYALDFGGYDHWVRVVAATDGTVVSAADESLPEYAGDEYPFINPRYDVVYIKDGRGWFYRYSHFSRILPHVKPGAEVKKGEWIGILGKEGASGGWSHLHFGIHGTEGDERGLIEGYPFIAEAWLNENPGALMAVARPHRLAAAGEPVILDGGKSICGGGRIVKYEWEFHDGTRAEGARVETVYGKPGSYSEILRVTDDKGRQDIDFAVVQALSADDPGGKLPPSTHAAYYPTTGIKPGDEVFFKARTFRVSGGKEHWDFGDGSEGTTESKNDYAAISHHYGAPGMYIVTVRRTSDNGLSSMARLKVIVE